MKKILLAITVMLFFSMKGYADEVYLSVAMPQICPLDNDAKTILKNKLFDAFISQGITASECSAIAVIPEVTIEEKIVEGGMKNIHIQHLDITLTIRNVVTNSIFKSLHLSCTGEGYRISEANRSAIRKINVRSKEFIEFIASSKTIIFDYYSKYTTTIISKARTLASQQFYDEALALLDTYPYHLEGYPQISQTIKTIFRQYQTHYCSKLIQSARQSYTLRDFEKAAEIASLVDPKCSCASDAKSILAQIKKEIDIEHDEIMSIQKEQIEAEQEKNKSEERIKSQLIDAVRDISKEYFKKQNRYLFFW